MIDPLPLPLPPRRGPGRPRLEEERDAPYRVVAERAIELKRRYPRLTWRRIAIWYVKVPPYTLYRYVKRYREVGEEEHIA